MEAAIELTTEDLVPAENLTLLEQRANAMMLERMAGKTDEQIALRFGVDPGVVNDLIQSAVDSCIAKKEHRLITAALVSKLTRLDVQLGELYEETPAVSKLSFQVLDQKGTAKTLWKEESNTQTKTKIISERRQNAMAIDKVVGASTGETTPSETQEDLAVILTEVRSTTREMTRELIAEVAQQARDAGRLEAEQARSTDIEAVEVREERL